MADYIDRQALYNALKKLAGETECDIAVLPDVAELIREAPAANVEPAQKWISVKDRLPEDDGPVITAYHFKSNAVRYISTLSYFCFDPQPHWQHESTGLVVTHWMPLPEPPKKDNENCTF